MKAKHEKKGQIEINETVVLIIAIIVLVIAFFFISGYSNRILSWISGLPSFEPQNNSIRNLTADEARLLGYEPVGLVADVEKAVPNEDWVKVGQWNILLLNKQMFSQSECTPAEKYDWKTNVCYDYFSFISNKTDDPNCQQYGTFIGKDGCFDKEGKTMWHESYVQTGIYISANSKEGVVNGDLIMYRPVAGTILNPLNWRSNQKIGNITNDFFYIYPEVYAQYQSELSARGVTAELINNLNKAKYVNGPIYKYKSVKTQLIPITPSAPNTIIPNSAISTARATPYVAIGPYVYPPGVHYLLAFQLQNTQSGFINFYRIDTLNPELIGRIYPDNSIWLDTNVLFKSYVRNPDLQTATTNPRDKVFYKSNLVIDYNAVLNAVTKK